MRNSRVRKSAQKVSLIFFPKVFKKSEKSFPNLERTNFWVPLFQKPRGVFLERTCGLKKCYRYNHEKSENFHTRVTGIIKFFGP